MKEQSTIQIKHASIWLWTFAYEHMYLGDHSVEPANLNFLYHLLCMLPRPSSTIAPATTTLSLTSTTTAQLKPG